MATTTDEQPKLQRLGVRPPLRVYLRDIWDKRDFALTGSLGDLRTQHMNTVFGSLWHLLNPLLLAAVYYVVFGIIFEADESSNYVAFLVIGIFVFFYTQKAMTAGSRTVIANLPLIQSLQFPRVVLPLAAVVGEGIAQLPALVMMMLLVVVTGEPVTLLWLLLVPAFLLQSLFNLGVGLITARMTFHFRDTQQLLPYVLRLWLYLSGVFYGLERIPEGPLRTAFQLNPVHAYIELSRDIFIRQAVDPGTWLVAGAWALVAAIAGFVFFRAKEVEYGRGY